MPNAGEFCRGHGTELAKRRDGFGEQPELVSSFATGAIAVQEMYGLDVREGNVRENVQADGGVATFEPHRILQEGREGVAGEAHG